MSTQSAASDGVRSLADHLRRWDETALAALLRARPDLATPAPQDSSQLASRVSTRASSARALDDLTHFELAIVGAVMTAQPVPREDLTGRGPAVASAVRTLEERALVWPAPEGLRVVSGVAEALGPGSFPTSTSPEPPAIPTTPRDQAMIDRAAAGAAFDVVRRLELVLESWSHRPVTALRAGGLGVRDLRALATALLVTPAQAALLTEIAVAAGLGTTAANEDGDPAWMPTDAYDSWLEHDPADRWVPVARAWLGLSRAPALVGGRDGQDKPLNALSPDLGMAGIVEARAMTLAALADLGPGLTLAAGTGLPGLLAQLAWSRPRRGGDRDRQAAWTLTEAGELGVTGLDGIATWSRHLLEGDQAAATAALSAALPSPIDHVVLQADLTAVAPGPLESGLARDLGLLAEVESGGGATVYRFSSGSLRRGLDAGWSAAEIHSFLATISTTPVPQPLTYLVDDCARTFGTVRVGHAETFLRSDDEEALLSLIHHPQADRLGLRLIAPTVLISATPLDVLLPRLREWGVTPVVEALDGSVHVARPDHHRARQARERHRTAAVAREAARIPGVVAAIRAGDAAAAARPRTDGPLSPADALGVLRTAIDGRRTVVLTYVDNHGTLSDRPVQPRALLDGMLRALDERSGEERAFAVHRIRDVRLP